MTSSTQARPASSASQRIRILRDQWPIAMVPTELVLSPLSDGAVRTYSVLVCWGRQDGEVWASREKIIEARRTSRATLRRHVAELEAAGWVERIPRGLRLFTSPKNAGDGDGAGAQYRAMGAQYRAPDPLNIERPGAQNCAPPSSDEEKKREVEAREEPPLKNERRSSSSCSSSRALDRVVSDLANAKAIGSGNGKRLPAAVVLEAIALEVIAKETRADRDKRMLSSLAGDLRTRAKLSPKQRAMLPEILARADEWNRSGTSIAGARIALGAIAFLRGDAKKGDSYVAEWKTYAAEAARSEGVR